MCEAPFDTVVLWGRGGVSASDPHGDAQSAEGCVVASCLLRPALLVPLAHSELRLVIASPPYHTRRYSDVAYRVSWPFPVTVDVTDAQSPGLWLLL